MKFSILFFFGMAGLVPIIYGQTDIKKAFHTLYKSQPSTFNKTVYLGDTMLTERLTYNMIKNYLNPQDTSIAKVILQDGVIKNLTPKQILNYLPDKLQLISLTNFGKIRNGHLNLNNCEIKIIQQLAITDSIYANTIGEKDSATNTQMRQQQEKLMSNKCFISYSGKIQKSTRRVLLFYPVYHYMNRYLICYSYYHSLTNCTLYIKII